MPCEMLNNPRNASTGIVSPTTASAVRIGRVTRFCQAKAHIVDGLFRSVVLSRTQWQAGSPAAGTVLAISLRRSAVTIYALALGAHEEVEQTRRRSGWPAKR